MLSDSPLICTDDLTGTVHLHCQNYKTNTGLWITVNISMPLRLNETSLLQMARVYKQTAQRCLFSLMASETELTQELDMYSLRVG